MAQHQQQLPPQMLSNPTVILLKEGTDKSQGIPQIISNINACNAVADLIKSTLGPRGMDKCIVKAVPVITNDGATILKELEIVHPAAKTLVEISTISQDKTIGDGTTSVILIASELLKLAKNFINDHNSPSIIANSYRYACELATKPETISTLLINNNKNIVDKDESHKHIKNYELLKNCAKTALFSKLIYSQRDYFAEIVIDAVTSLESPKYDLNHLGIKKVLGGSILDSKLVRGIAFKKTFSYAGFEQQPKKIENPKILLLNVELELKSEKDNAEIRINNVKQYNEIVNAEWEIILTKLKLIVNSKAQVVLSKLAIGDLATQYFADNNIFSAGRVPIDDLNRIARGTGAKIQTSLDSLTEDILGTCSLFEEKQVGSERFNFLTGIPGHASTIILRGGALQFIDEAERSLNDAIMVVKRLLVYPDVVAGGGAIEMELSKMVRAHAISISNKTQLMVSAFARALEIIPRQLSINAGFDATDIITALRAKHAAGFKHEGVDIDKEGTADMTKKLVFEPALVKINAIRAATEAACLILSVDETIRNEKSQS